MSSVLVTAWGQFPCPADLVELHRLAPKKRVWREDENGKYPVEVVDPDTTEGHKFYKREAELMTAIDTIEATAELRVVPA